MARDPDLLLYDASDLFRGALQAVGDEWTEDLVFDVPRDHEEVARLEASVEGTDEGPLKPGSVVELINGNPAIIVAVSLNRFDCLRI
jgi:hypothetical protein